jgi:hypothetical protein
MRDVSIRSLESTQLCRHAEQSYPCWMNEEEKKILCQNMTQCTLLLSILEGEKKTHIFSFITFWLFFFCLLQFPAVIFGKAVLQTTKNEVGKWIRCQQYNLKWYIVSFYFKQSHRDIYSGICTISWHNIRATYFGYLWAMQWNDEPQIFKKRN